MSEISRLCVVISDQEKFYAKIEGEKIDAMGLGQGNEELKKKLASIEKERWIAWSDKQKLEAQLKEQSAKIDKLAKEYGEHKVRSAATTSAHAKELETWLNQQANKLEKVTNAILSQHGGHKTKALSTTRLREESGDLISESSPETRQNLPIDLPRAKARFSSLIIQLGADADRARENIELIQENLNRAKEAERKALSKLSTSVQENVHLSTKLIRVTEELMKSRLEIERTRHDYADPDEVYDPHPLSVFTFCDKI
jgi:hypothetical protein